jgi:hypothetical protein
MLTEHRAAGGLGVGGQWRGAGGGDAGEPWARDGAGDVDGSTLVGRGGATAGGRSRGAVTLAGHAELVLAPGGTLAGPIFEHDGDGERDAGAADRAGRWTRGR